MKHSLWQILKLPTIFHLDIPVDNIKYFRISLELCKPIKSEMSNIYDFKQAISIIDV